MCKVALLRVISMNKDDVSRIFMLWCMLCYMVAAVAFNVMLWIQVLNGYLNSVLVLFLQGLLGVGWVINLMHFKMELSSSPEDS